VVAVPVVHPVEAFGLRVTMGDASIAYTGDSGPCDALDRLAGGADLLLAEASFREADDNPPEIHLTGADGGALAARAQVGRLVMTHIPPWFDKQALLAEAQAVWDGPVDLASPGTAYEL
jgi:ribonuclease BN (tRNA processing enzyme)